MAHTLVCVFVFISEVQTATQLDCTATLRGHSKSVLALAVCPNGTLVSGSADTTIKLWTSPSGGVDATDYVCTATLTGHSDTVCALEVCPNGTLVSGSADTTIKLWKSPSWASRLPVLHLLSQIGCDLY